MKRTIVVLLLMAFSVFAWAEREKNIVSSVLKSAMVYRAGAELTHTAKAYLNQGNNELIIDNISNRIDVNSLRIGSNGNVTILSVEFSTNFLLPDQKSPLVKKLEDSLESVNDELTKVQVVLKTDQELLDLLKANKEIRGTQTGVSVAELTKMMDYYKAKTLEIQNEVSRYRDKETKLLGLSSKVNQQIKEEAQKNNKTIGKILLQLYCPVAGQYDFNVSYITPAAFWTPSYDLRVENINKPVALSYKAKLVQTTGINWQQVKLALSTSVPSQNNIAPELKSWFLVYNNVERALEGRIYGVSAAPQAAAMSEVLVVGLAKKEADKDDEEQKPLGDYVNVKDNELNVVFDIDLPYDVPTNGKEQNVSLKDYTIPANYKYFSAPRLDRDAYLLGEVVDWEALNLLPGEANIIFEGTYIGKTAIDAGSTKDTLNLTLGKDKRVVVTREKMTDYSSVKFLGSNKKQTFTYEITVRNNKKEAIEMELQDQYPLSTNKDIEVELLQHDGATVNEETGIVTWKVKLAPGEVKKYRLGYSVKYPKDREINL